MNWISTSWSMVTGACLALGLIYLASGLRGASRRINILFALIAFLMAAYSWIELALFHVATPAAYLNDLRWLDVVGSSVAVAMTTFVWVYCGARRRWLAIASLVLLGSTLILDLLPTPRLVFLSLSGINADVTFAGLPFTIAEGVRNPWNNLYYLALVLLLGFVFDASLGCWARGERRRAVLIGGSIVATLLVAGVHSYLVDTGFLRVPHMISFAWLFVLAAMAWELSTDQLHAVQFARELNDYRERLDFAASAANLSVWEWNVVEDAIRTYGPRGTRIGLAEGEQATFQRALASVHESDRASLLRAVRDTLDRSGELKSEFRVYAADGATRWVSVHGRAMRSPSGDAHHLRGISLDITERKLAELALQDSESRLREAQSIAHVGSWEWEIGIDRVTWSDETYRIFGMDPAVPPPSFENHEALYTRESLATLRHLVQLALDKGEPFDVELEFVRADGAHGFQISRGRAIRNAQGRVSRLAGTVEDVTAQKRHETEIADLRHELAHFNRIMQLNELFASLAHEINQPLGAILNNATAAKWLCSAPEQKKEEITEILQCIVDDTKRASQVIRDVRGMARREDVRFEPLSINATIEEIERLTRKTLRDNQVSLVLDLQPDIARIRGSRTGLQQVLLNLITNAQDAMRESQTKTLTVSSRMASPERILVCVRDTGPGLDEVAQSRVFNAFYTTKKDGLGMGLRICQSIIDEHGGEIWFEERANGGAVVCFSVPVDQGGSA